MLIYLKRTILIITGIVFLFIILGNTFFYFYGSSFISYLSKDLVNIGKVEYSLLPFSSKLKDVKVVNEDVHIKSRNLTVSLNSITSLLKGKHMINVSIENLFLDINQPEDSSSDIDYMKLVSYFNNVIIKNSFIKYEGFLIVEAQLDILSLSQEKMEFNILSRDVVFKKKDFVEKLNISIKGKMGEGQYYLKGGGISGKLIALKIDDNSFKGSFDAKFLRFFNISSEGYINLTGKISKNSFLDYNLKLSVLNNIFESYGSLFKKNNKIFFNIKNFSTNKFSCSVDSIFHSKKGLFKGDVKLKDGILSKLDPFTFSVNFNRRILNINGGAKFNERYQFALVGGFRDKFNIKKFEISSDSTVLNLKGNIGDKALNFKIEGQIKNNSDIIMLAKKNHNIALKGEYSLIHGESSGFLDLKFGDNKFYNIKKIQTSFYGRDKFRLTYIINFLNGYIDGNADFMNFSNWSLDYALHDVNISNFIEYNKKSKITGYGVFNKREGISSKGVLNIVDFFDNPIRVSYNTDGKSVNINIDHSLDIALKNIQNNSSKIDINGRLKGISLDIFGNLTISDRYNFVFSKFDVNELSLGVEASLDSSLKNLNINVENKKSNFINKLQLGSFFDEKEKKYIIDGYIDTNREKYRVSGKIKKGETVEIDKLELFSKTTSIILQDSNISGSNKYLKISGKLNNNKDILAFCHIKHNLKLESNFKLRDSKLSFDLGVNIVNNLYTVRDIELEGVANLDSFSADINGGIHLANGLIKLKCDKQNRGPLNFNIKTEGIPVGDIGGINNKLIKKTSLLTFDINGSYNDDLLIKGKTALEGSIFNKFDLYVIYNKKRLILKELNIDNDNFKDFAYYSFSNKNIYVDIETPHIKNNLFEAKNVKIFVDGVITDPSFNIYGELFNIPSGKSILNIEGNLKKAKADLNFKDYSVNIDYKKVDLSKFLIGINAQYKEKLTLSLPLKVKYLSGFAFNITARKGSINIQPLGEILLNDIQFFADKKGIKDFNCNINNEIFKNIKLIDVDINEKGIKGDIDLNNGILEYNNMFLLKTVGGVGFYYNYRDPVMLSGEINGRGKVNWEGFYLKLPINKFNIKFDGLNITFNAVLNELDSYLNISYKASNYMDYLDSSLEIEGKHIYINKLGFSGMFDLDLFYDNSERKLKGDVFLVKSYYDVDGYVKTTSTGTTNIKLPIGINLNVKTINPVKINNKYANANVNVNLNVIYERELKVFGKLFTSDSYITIGQEKLVIFDNYILFKGTLAPYLYLEARGTGNYSYILLKISGNLPNYNISIIDLNPSNRGSYETKSSYNPQNLITDIFAGVLLGDLLNVTENIIGINSIGFEQSNVEGEYVNSLKIGRRFSDRFEVNYVVNTSSDEEGGEVVGEYSLLDWFKLIFYSENKGGSGFGINFFTDF